MSEFTWNIGFTLTYAIALTMIVLLINRLTINHIENAEIAILFGLFLLMGAWKAFKGFKPIKDPTEEATK